MYLHVHALCMNTVSVSVRDIARLCHRDRDRDRDRDQNGTLAYVLLCECGWVKLWSTWF
jgi:hypothetical protein